jgi:hypothetical protein
MSLELEIGFSSDVKLKNVIARIRSEERLASGRGGALAKDGRINAHNTFNDRSQVLTAQELVKSGEPSLALFACTSDYFARKHADIFTRNEDHLRSTDPLHERNWGRAGERLQRPAVRWWHLINAEEC